MEGAESRWRLAIFRDTTNNEIMLSPSSLETASNVETSSVGSNSDNRPLSQQRSLFQSLSGFVKRRTISDDYEELSPVRRLTTFSGVYAPVCLSMFSAILFLRLGYAVGQAGFLATLGLFAIAYVIVTCTVFSICAISTNGAVEGGGAYFMISRALGPEFGGGIGVLFFLANIFSGALYVSGSVETIINSFGRETDSGSGLPVGRWFSFLYGASICVFNMGVCVVGASLFAYMSAFILAIVGTSAFVAFISYFIKNSEFGVPIPTSNSRVYCLPSNGTTCQIPVGVDCPFNSSMCYANYTGFSSATFHENLLPSFGIDYTNVAGDIVSAATVFAVLFNGVTGIMSGANVAGELKNPAKSIPRGTLSALGTTAVVYTTIVLMFLWTCSNALLKNNYTLMQSINVWPPIITIGVLAATLSAAMTNLMGASRVLLALARDNLFGVLLRPFGKTTASGNPVPAVLTSFLLTTSVLLIPSLNQIAVITSVFFLLSYFANNLACLALELASAPNWRPKYRFFSWHTAVIGMIGCATMMFIISPLYTAIAFVIAILLMIGLHFWSPDINWGSISQALIFHQVRKYLLLLDIRKEHVKYWRPQMLLFVSEMDANMENMADFVNDLKKGGLFVIGHVRQAVFEELDCDPVQDDHPKWMELIDRLKIKAFVEITVARTIREGVHHLVHLSGLGGMKPNTVVMGFPRCLQIRAPSFDSSTDGAESFIHPSEFISILRDCLKMRKNLCVARNFGNFNKKLLLKNKLVNIDVWPQDFMRPFEKDNHDTATLFLLQLACILQMSSTWRKKATLRVFLPYRLENENLQRRVRALNVLLNQLRIKGKVTPIIWDEATQHVDRSHRPANPDVVGGSQLDPYSLPDGYIHEVQRMLRFHSQSAAVTFLYMPAPPVQVGKDDSYLAFLEAISALNGPAIMVHGISIVTSTTI